jgi:regulator of sigma E protease
MGILQNFFWYMILIGVMILIHELGHYVAARIFDVKVETFSFGFGKRLWGFQHGETDFRISLIPFGGYVKMTGEQYSGDVNDPKGAPADNDPRALTSKPRWQRMIIAFAGPGINIVLAIGLLAGLFMVHYPKVPNPNSPFIGYLLADGPAAKAGVRVGDQLVQVDDMVDPTWEQINLHEVTNANHPMQVWVKRGSERLHLTVTPALDEKQGVGSAGWEQESDVEVAEVRGGMSGDKAGLQAGDVLVSVNGEKLRYTKRLNEIEKETDGAPLDLVYSRRGVEQRVTVKPVKHNDGGESAWLIGLTLSARREITRLALPQALYESTRQNIQYTKVILQLLERMVSQRMPAKSLSGPIGMAKMSGDAAREGVIPFIGLMAGVSLNLAIFNLLPIPILDGGVMLMLFIEMLMRRDVDLKVKETVLKVGFIFLMFVLVFAIYNDISKSFPAG